MKKFILVVLFSLTVFSFSGCDVNNEASDIENVIIDYGESSLYSKEDMDSAIGIILDEFKKWNGHTIYTISYTNDTLSKKNIDYCNSLKEDASFDECIIFESSFHTSKRGGDGFEPDTEHYGWSWYLARSDKGSWQLITNGFC